MISKKLSTELSHIHTREDLVTSSSKLKRQFDELVDTIIAAREYQQKHSDIDMQDISRSNHLASDALREELNRVYRIEGCRQIIEKCQENALNRLDAFEKRLTQQKK